MARRIFLVIGISLIAISIPITVVLLLKRTQVKEKAAVSEGLTTVTLEPQTGTFAVGESFDVKIKINTAGIGVSVITVYLTYTYDRTLEFEIIDADGNPANGTQIKTADIPQLNYITNDVTLDAPTKKVIIRLAAMIANPEEAYFNTSDTLFGTMNFKALAPVESRTISFDQELSRITHAESAEDILLIPTNGFYTITGETTSPPPKITGFSPSSGKVGTTVSIEGENFGEEQRTGLVKFSETQATEIDDWSDKNISAKVPDRAESGKISVTTTGGTAASSEDFEVLEDEEPPETPPPVISSFSPDSGKVGTRVVITGDHFGDEKGTSKLKFNAVEATDIITWTNLLIEARTPQGATTGKISLVTDWGTAISSENFDVTKDRETPPEDTTPPTITNIAASEITENSAKITWSTNETATSQVEYGLTNNYGNLTVKEPTPKTNHALVLTALNSSTTYHFRVKSEDNQGNPSVSEDKTFATSAPTPPADTTAPVISNIKVENITTTSAKITWTTNEVASSQLQYGKTSLYGNSTPKETTMVTNHTALLRGLTPDTTYHYQAISEDSSGNKASSEDGTFKTNKEAQGGAGDDSKIEPPPDGDELPETGIEEYTNIVLVSGGFLVFLGFTITKLAAIFTKSTRKRKYKTFERKIINSD